MKKLFSVLLVGLCAASAWADVTIQDVLVRKRGNQVNVRVNLINLDGPTVNKPVITLYIRPDENSEWEQIKVWTNIAKIGVGEKVSRDFFEENNARLAESATHPAFEVKAAFRAQGVDEYSKTTVYNEAENGEQ